MEQFLSLVREQPSSAILDLGGANQANINYITNLGHRISSENVLDSLDSIWNDSRRSEGRKIDDFLEEAFRYEPGALGGALVWDSLQYFPPPLLEAAIQRMFVLMQPGAVLLSFFHADEKAKTVPAYTYRIIDTRTLLLTPRGLRNRTQFFNNRALERLFQRYASVKFFLTRDHLREVLVRR